MSNSLDIYLSKRDAIQTGDAIQWQSRSILGWLIRWRTNSEANHTSIAVRFKEYDTERVYILEALEHGTVLNPLSARLKKHDGKAWLLPLKADYAYLRKPMGQWALEHVGVGYDYPGLVKQLWRKVTPNSDRLFCSEYWWMALTEAARRMGAEKVVLEARKILMGKAPQPADIPKLGLTQKEIQIL